MSLLITSSRQQEFDNVGSSTIGIEQPYSYINHMNSPLIIDANSEIAVVSIKCERDAKLVIDPADRDWETYIIKFLLS